MTGELQNARSSSHRPLILVTGATGYIGSELLKALEASEYRVRAMVRPGSRHRLPPRPSTEVVEGDALLASTVENAVRGVDVIYYLVHMLASRKGFAEQERLAAHHFAQAAKRQEVRRIIYLGGLGDDADPRLSPHLRSRHEVGRILSESGVETIEFRAGMVIGAGSASFQLMKSLTDRLPIMICPRWLATPTQPIGIDDLLAYLLAALDLPLGDCRRFEIGGADVTTYAGLIRECARQLGKRRWLISVPVLTPYLSGLWLALVTPASYSVGRHLIEGLRNPTVVRNEDAASTFGIRPIGVKEAMRRALASLPK